MTDPHHVPTARDIMTHSLVTFRPEMSVFDAITQLIARKVSGAPVLDADGTMVGMISEMDCLKTLASDDFHHDEHDALVSDYMSTSFETVGPECDIYSLAQYFLRRPVRRFPVMEDGALLGQVSRRDVLRGIEEMRKKRAPRKHYPDYREPSFGRD
jgi:predicted transcriptional regulator